MLCPGCFHEKSSALTCPHCGYDESLKRSPMVLPHHMRLNQGHYRLGRVLGKPGGFGITYLGWDERLQTKVAIKEYLPRELAGRDADHRTVAAHSGEDADAFAFGLGKFLEEARTLAKLDHPNLVRVRDFFEENGTAYLVMDFYDGLTLAEYLARQPGSKLPEDQAIGILLPILDGLREVHAKGFLHRDIKPANIYLTAGNRPILLDFGAARQAMGEHSRSLSVVLSEGYAPIEQYQRNGKQGPWTDVYGAVATFYNLITGKVPLSAIDRINNPTAELSGSTVFDDRIRLILNKGLHPDYAQRIQSVEDLQSLLGIKKESDYANAKGKEKEIAKSRSEKKDAWTSAVVRSEQSQSEPEDPAWNAVAPFYISALTGQRNIDNDPDPKGDYWISSIIFMLLMVGGSVFGASSFDVLIGFTQEEAVGVMSIIGIAGWGGAYAILSMIPSYSRMHNYERAKAYLPVFQRLYSGQRTHKTGVNYILIPTAWLGYWGLWKELGISVSAFLIIDASPAILSLVFGAQNTASIILYKITEHQIFYLGFWLLMSYRYDGAIYKKITGLLEPFFDEQLNDPVVIYDKTRPRLFRGFLSFTLFLSLIVGLGTILDPMKYEISASIEAEKGDYSKSFEIALQLYEKKQYEDAAKWVKPLSDKGYAPAQSLMGIFYEEGTAPEYAPKDPEKAFSLYKLAAEAGHKDAKIFLADAYYFGTGVTQDAASAFIWYMKAAADGEQEAIYKVGYLYWTGDGVKPNQAKAFEYMKRAADTGYPRAQGMLGYFYQNGVGVKKDINLGIDYLNRALSTDDHVAQYYMGRNYYYGDGVTKDPRKALDLFVKSANAGIPGAQYQLGAILVVGDVVPQDIESGRGWLKKASEQGVDEATNFLKNIDNP